MMQTMLSAMPRDMQQDAARHLRHTLDHGLPPSAQAMLGEQADTTTRLLNGMQAPLQKQEKEQHARSAIHPYHCDHLGAPMALTDQTGQVAWAAKLDPWGNVLQEYNPQGIHQAIRLPGQHHDRETGLYYNRHRDRKSTRLNSSHSQISYAVFCLKKKKNKTKNDHNHKIIQA